MITFHHAPQSRSAIVRWMLEEIGEPYRLHPLGFKKGETRAAAYLAINPMGKVPAIDHDGVIVTEAAAICCYLADAFVKPVSPCRSAIAVGARISNGCSSGRAV
jgi:glutathione S-transferase